MASRTKLLQRHLSSATHSIAKMEYISTKKAVQPFAAYSQATKANGVVYVSGQLPVTPEGKMVEGDIQEKAHQAFKNLGAVLGAAGSDFSKILKLSVFSTDIKIFGDVNEVYNQYLKDHRPARTFVAVRELPLKAELELECIALAD